MQQPHQEFVPTWPQDGERVVFGEITQARLLARALQASDRYFSGLALPAPAPHAYFNRLNGRVAANDDGSAILSWGKGIAVPASLTYPWRTFPIERPKLPT